MPSRDAYATVPRDVILSLNNLTTHQALACACACALSFALQALVHRVCSKRYPTFWRSLDARGRADVAVRVVAGAFGIISSVWSIALLIESGRATSSVERVYAKSGTALRARGETLFAAACGYFVWDVVLAVVEFENYGGALCVHAVASLAAFAVPLMMPPGFLYEFGARFLAWEITAPFLGARAIMIKAKKTDGWAFAAIERVGFALFFVVRFVFGVPAMLTVLRDVYDFHSRGLAKPEGVYAMYAVAALLFPLMNCLWVYKMVKVVFRGKKKKSA